MSWMSNSSEEYFTVTKGENFNMYIPKNITESTPVAVYFPCQGGESIYYALDGAAQCKTDAIIIIPTSCDAQSTCQAIQSASQMVDANFDNVGLFGASVGGKSVILTAEESLNSNYGFKITSMNCFDSIQAEACATENICKHLASNDISLFVNTDIDGLISNDLVQRFCAAGGKGVVAEYNSVIGHEFKCNEPFYNNVINWAFGKGNFTEDAKYGLFNDEKNARLFYSYKDNEKKAIDIPVYGNATLSLVDDNKIDETEEINEDPTEETANGDDIVSVEYDFVKANMESLYASIINSNIVNIGNVNLLTSGSLTFAAANEAFNNYSSMTISFLSSIGVAYQNVIMVADSMYQLDKSLTNEADNLDGYVDTLCSQDLSFAHEFYNNINLESVVKAFDFTDNNGEIKITKDGLLAALSDSNVITSTLLKDITDTNNIKQVIDGFIDNSKNNLQGPVWDKVRDKMDEYSMVCSEKNKYANGLIDGLQAAYQKLLAYMEEYDELDTSMIEEFNLAITEITNQIESLQIQYDELNAANGKKFDILDDSGDVVYSYTIDNSIAMAQVNELISLCQEIKIELEKNLGKIEGLSSADSEAAKEIVEAEETDKPTIELTSPVSTIPSSGNFVDAVGTAITDEPVIEEETQPIVKEEVDTEPTNDEKSSIDVSSGEEPTSLQPSVDNGNDVTANSSDVQKNVVSEYEAITTNQNRLVYNIDNECKLVINNDGNNVTGMEYFYDFGNQETAISMLETINTKYTNMEGFNGVSVSDRYIRVLFSPEFYQSQNLDFFKNIFSNYEII